MTTRTGDVLREVADRIEAELICCDAYERGDHQNRHQICFWSGAARQLVLDRAAQEDGDAG